MRIMPRAMAVSALRYTWRISTYSYIFVHMQADKRRRFQARTLRHDWITDKLLSVESFVQIYSYWYNRAECKEGVYVSYPRSYQRSQSSFFSRAQVYHHEILTWLASASLKTSYEFAYPYFDAKSGRNSRSDSSDDRRLLRSRTRTRSRAKCRKFFVITLSV